MKTISSYLKKLSYFIFALILIQFTLSKVSAILLGDTFITDQPSYILTNNKKINKLKQKVIDNNMKNIETEITKLKEGQSTAKSIEEKDYYKRAIWHLMSMPASIKSAYSKNGKNYITIDRLSLPENLSQWKKYGEQYIYVNLSKKLRTYEVDKNIIFHVQAHLYCDDITDEYQITYCKKRLNPTFKEWLKFGCNHEFGEMYRSYMNSSCPLYPNRQWIYNKEIFNAHYDGWYGVVFKNGKIVEMRESYSD